MIGLFAGIGMGTVTLIVVVVFSLLVETLKGLLHELKWKHTYKHRFDKPPTAKCYCKDCIYHDKTGSCSSLSLIDGPLYYTADNWFCWKADPRKNKEKHDG